MQYLWRYLEGFVWAKRQNMLLWANHAMFALRGVLQFASGTLLQIFAIANSPSLRFLYTFASAIKTILANISALQKILSELYVFKSKTAEIAEKYRRGEAISYRQLRCMADDTMHSLTTVPYMVRRNKRGIVFAPSSYSIYMDEINL